MALMGSLFVTNFGMTSFWGKRILDGVMLFVFLIFVSGVTTLKRVTEQPFFLSSSRRINDLMESMILERSLSSRLRTGIRMR